MDPTRSDLLTLAIEGPTNKEVFEAYVEDFLGPALKEGQIAVMDNHGPTRAKGLGS